MGYSPYEKQIMTSYILIGILLIVLEVAYCGVAKKLNIVDRPNERSSHTRTVIRGGGIIFLFGVWLWTAFFAAGTEAYPLFLAAVSIAAGISFIDDVKSLPDAARLVTQIIATALMVTQLYLCSKACGAVAASSLPTILLLAAAAIFVCVGATNIYNFMDGINGITAGYSLAVLVPLALLNARSEFIPDSFIIVAILAVLVFAFFNFRPKGKALCFAGDVGSVGMAFILLFAIGMLIVKTRDVTWFALLLVYGIDGVMTIIHRLMLHENLGQAHRKHAYQILANELKVSHIGVSCLYMSLQLAVSLVMIYLVPDSPAMHWIFLAAITIVLTIAYWLFMKKYYHLHAEYLESLKKN